MRALGFWPGSLASKVWAPVSLMFQGGRLGVDLTFPEGLGFRVSVIHPFGTPSTEEKPCRRCGRLDSAGLRARRSGTRVSSSSP